MTESEVFLEEYTLLDELGQGGYATVYKVRHNKLGYIRAIKVLNATIAHGESDKTYQKFLEECRLLLRLGNGNHSNIVHIYQPLLKAQKAIVEMDYVDGPNIYNYLQSKGTFVEIGDVLKLLTDIGSALAYCHEDIYKFCMDRKEDNLQDDPRDGSKVLLTPEIIDRLIHKYRVIHNDIHSGNIIRREDGSYVLLDFGLAIEGDSVIRSSRKKNGAPEFKAPEKWNNEAILTTQSDIYSFGVVLYEFLAGRVPFLFDKKNSNTTEAEYLLGKAHQEQRPAPIFELRKAAFEESHPGVAYEKDYPDWLEELIMKCLEKNTEERFANGKELYQYVLKNLDAQSELQTQKYIGDINTLQQQITTLEQEKMHNTQEWNKKESDYNTTITSLKKQIENTSTTVVRKSGGKWIFFTIFFLLTTCAISYYALTNASETEQKYLRKIDQLNSQIEGYKNTQASEVENQRQQLIDKQSTINIQKEEINSLKQQLSSQQSNTTNNTQEINQLKRQIKTLQNENNKLQNENTNLKSRNNNLKKEISTLEGELQH